MKKYIYLPILTFFACILFSCGEKKNEQAILYLDNIRSLYDQKEYTSALQKIDSIQILFPKAIPEIKEGMKLKQEVRKTYNQQQVADCDSLLSIYSHRIDSIKPLFVYQKDKEDSKGIYIPKTVSSSVISANGLRAGVEESGAMYIESVYIGGQLHNRISASTKDKQTAESLPVEDDGFNFRFSNLGKQYEVIKVSKFHDNGLTQFIVNNANTPLTVTLKGKNTLSYPMSNIQKKAITDSYQLSTMILLHDSLQIAKEKAEALIKYVDTKQAAQENNPDMKD